MTATLRKIILSLVLTLAVFTAHAQLGTTISYFYGWKRAFSEEGMTEWRPEFTLRYSLGFRTSGPSVTAGIRVDRNRTLGIVVGQWTHHIPKYDASVYTYGAGLYMRSYLHLGRRETVSLYSDAAAGLACVFKTTGGYTDPDTGLWRGSDKRPGDIKIFGAWEPGIRVRVYDRLHIFAGPTIATKCYGLHVGIGF